ncbi:MAG: hypothetical protein HQL02_05345 [Nitrospirae bacterium]|nr:hypothetical protein [Nitrospirota bacterium]
MNKIVNTLRGFVLLIVIGSLFILSGCAATSAVVKSEVLEGDLQCGKVQGAFRGRWFNYYERGLSFSSCGQVLLDKEQLDKEQREAARQYLKSAARDLEAAIRIRKDERWHARTYGMHYVDYFPHRELGIVYFLLGDNKNAEKELAVSLGLERENSGKAKKKSDEAYDTATSKAVYYLNEARGKLSKSEQKPEITLLRPQKAEGNLTNKCKYEISGVITSDNYVKPAIINGEPLLYCLEATKENINEDKPLPVGLSAKACGFKTKVDICELGDKDSKTITVGAVDVAGISSKEPITVTLDREGPAIAINSVSEVDGKIKVGGTVYDDSGIKEVIVNGESLFVGKADMIEKGWSFDVALAANGIAIKAVDKAGNVTEYTLPDTHGSTNAMNEMLLAQSVISDAIDTLLTANSGNERNNNSCVVAVNNYMRLANIGKSFEITRDCVSVIKEFLQDIIGVKNLIELYRFVKDERNAAMKEALTVIQDFVKLFYHRFPFGATLGIQDNNYIRLATNEFGTYENSLDFNISLSNYDQGTKFSLLKGNEHVCDKALQEIGIFNIISCNDVLLDPGDNRIELIVTAQSGEQMQPLIYSVKKLDIVESDYLLSIGIIVVDKNGQVNDFTRKVYNEIFRAFNSVKSKRFNVIDTSKKLQIILSKLKYETNTEISIDNARDAGREAEVDMFLLLSIDENEIIENMIDTGNLVVPTITTDRDIQMAIIKTLPLVQTRVFEDTSIPLHLGLDNDLKMYARYIVKRLKYEFPFTEGKIVRINSDGTFEVDKGKSKWNIRRGTRYLLFRNANDPNYYCRIINFRHPERCQGLYSKAVVKTVSDKTSDAQVIEINPHNDIHINDRVMTK